MSSRTTRLNKLSLDSKESNHQELNVVKKTFTSMRTTRSAKFYQTSDYSSEEGETEVTSSTRHLNAAEKARIIEDARRAASDSEPITALGFYRKAQSYWEKYPKTDWTYSPLSKDRVEIAPGVVAMPNMSRRHIRSYSEKKDYDYSDSYDESYRPRQLFHEENIFRSIYKKITSTFFSIFVVTTATVWALASYSYYMIDRSTIEIMKFVHRMTSKVMVLDTWLLRRRGPSGKKNYRLALLCLIPLAVFGGYWLFSTMNNNLLPTIFFARSKNAEPTSVYGSKITEEQLAKIANLIINDKKGTDKIINRILETPDVQNVVTRSEDIEKLFKNQRKIIEDLRKELEEVKSSGDRYSEQITELRDKITDCCDKDLRSYVYNMISEVINDSSFLNDQRGLRAWLSSILIAEAALEEKLSNLTRNLEERLESTVKSNGEFLMDQISSRIKRRVTQDDNVGEERIKDIVKEVLTIYDADKTGLVDYAMEPMGGQVLTTRCTESYHAGNAVLSVMGIPLWYPTSSPRTVITPGINPGKCWAFQNFPGMLVIKLAVPIEIEAFSMEHVSRLLVPDGNIDSAPKNFEVYGLYEEDTKSAEIIGSYQYDSEADSLQFFAVGEAGRVYEYIEIRILSNHGNPNYTCLYRFRVHGKRRSKR